MRPAEPFLAGQRLHEAQTGVPHGRLANLKREMFVDVFNSPIEERQPCVIVEPGVIWPLQAMTAHRSCGDHSARFPSGRRAFFCCARCRCLLRCRGAALRTARYRCPGWADAATPEDQQHFIQGIQPMRPSLIVWASPAKKHGRSRCRAPHRAACGVSPLTGIHHSLAPLG